MEEDILKFCKELIREQGNVFNVYCDLICDFCPFNDKANNRKCGDRPVKEIIQIAQNYIKEHEKTVNTIEKIEEKITLKELQEMKNNVEHPAHYTNGKYECINVIEDVTKDLVGLEAVCTANVIKYMWRWKLKNGVEDLKKARWYLNKLIDNTEGMED